MRWIITIEIVRNYIKQIEHRISRLEAEQPAPCDTGGLKRVDIRELSDPAARQAIGQAGKEVGSLGVVIVAHYRASVGGTPIASVQPGLLDKLSA